MTAFAAAMGLVLTLPMLALARNSHPNPSTAYVSLAGPVAAAGGRVVPLINSGQTFNNETFEGIPDGLGLKPVGNGSRYVDIYVTFEQSHVPFQGFADFEDSSVQRARLDLRTNQIVKLEEVLPPSAGFIRFCSATMVGPAEGFSDYTFLVNEESNDVIDVPAGASYGADPSTAPYRQAGYSVALDTGDFSFDEIAGLGRHNHENTVVVPGGWGDVAVLSGDDTFTAPSSQLYLYLADSLDGLKQDTGSLWAFQVTGTDAGPLDDPSDPQNDANDYLEINPGDDWTGHFIPVPDDVADGTTSAQPQQGLEDWSNANNVFQFVRVEDIGYDPDNPRVVYFADTGSTRIQEGATGRLFRAAADQRPYFDSDGRIFKMVLDEDDPTVVDSFSILAQGKLQLQEPPVPPDTAPVITVIDPGVGIVNPDNVGVGHTSLMVQEDSSANNDVWQHPLGTADWNKVASTTQAATAETSGIVDASTWLGAGWWVLDVQSHVNLPAPPGVDTGPFVYTTPITGVELTYNTRREDGQLLLMYIPNS
jgi:uncharacterized protein DUF839